jgi:hypothetical protein
MNDQSLAGSGPARGLELGMVTPYIMWRLYGIYAPVREVRERMRAEASQAGIEPHTPATEPMTGTASGQGRRPRRKQED